MTTPELPAPDLREIRLDLYKRTVLGAGEQPSRTWSGPPGRLLADDWTVIHLANLVQLSPKRHPRWHSPALCRDGGAVFAHSYADQPGLPTLDASTAEASDAFGAVQRATRSVHSEYRDWGAFYLTGGYKGSADNA